MLPLAQTEPGNRCYPLRLRRTAKVEQLIQRLFMREGWPARPTSIGQHLKAIREHQDRATSLGYDTDSFKLLAFVISGALAGTAGATKSLVFQLASLTDVHWSMSGEVVLMTLVGGMGTLFGPVAGAVVIVTMQNYLAQLGAWVTVVQGAIFVACVLALRRGIIGEISNQIKKKL
jgi:branched-chain amino acid transport system permease protein